MRPWFYLRFLRACFGARELERDRAKVAEEAEFTGVNEHSEATFNAVSPTRSRPEAGSQGLRKSRTALTSASCSASLSVSAKLGMARGPS